MNAQPEISTRIKNDINGNPRRVAHFLCFLNDEDNAEAAKINGLEFVGWKYNRALDRTRRLGGRKFHNKQFAGGIVFKAYSDKEVQELAERAKAIKL